MKRLDFLRALAAQFMILTTARRASAESATPRRKSSGKTTSTKKSKGTSTPKKGSEIVDPNAPKKTDLVSLVEIDPTIIIDIVLSRPENPFHYQFFKENVAYVRRAAAKKIAAVQKDLQKRGLGLKIWSAYRPQPVQIKMYELVGRDGYKVSDPYDPNSKKAHVRAVAIDCTLVDKDGKELEMPTPYLDFDNFKKAAADYPDLPEPVKMRRALLKQVMNDHGMWGYSKEWWHFQDSDIMDYKAVTMKDFPELHQKMLVDEMLGSAERGVRNAEKRGGEVTEGVGKTKTAEAKKAAGEKKAE